MHLTCTKAEARFSAEGFLLASDQPLSLLWDCHHGDTFVLQVRGLKAAPLSGEPAAWPITLEVDLAPFTETMGLLETFAAHHNLGLTLWPSLPEELTEPLTLAACHLPEVKLFVFCEQATLAARIIPEGRLRLMVAGDFKSRKVPCQETDLLLHLERPGASRLLSYCFSAVRQRV
jgi:hypothetical protein